MSFIHSVLALLTAFIWGTNFVVIRYGLDFVPPLWFAFWRFFLVAFPLIFFVRRPQKHFLKIALFGIAIGVGQFAILFLAMESDISAGLASLVIQSQVLFTPILAAIIWREEIGKNQRLGLLLGILGLVLVGIHTGGDITLKGLIMVLFAALSWTLGNLLVKSIGNTDALSLLAWSSLCTIPFLYIIAYLKHGPLPIAQLLSLPKSAQLAIVWQSLGNSLFGYAIWNTLLTRYPSASVTPWALLVPIFGIGAAAIVLSESLQWWKITAALFVVSGVALALKKDRKPNPRLATIK